VSRRWAGPALLAVSAVVSVLAFEAIGGVILRRALSAEHAADVDHRLKPNPRRGVNADGIRSPHGPEHYTPESWNLVFLGDSFTYGAYVKSEAAFPRLAGELLGAQLGTAVKVANFGWASSSPLLSLRLLREKGARYHPDLVVLCLDMTDFHDDLRYGRMLGEGGGRRFSPTGFLIRRLGYGGALERTLRRVGLGEADLPAQRFFVTNQPLEQSRPFLAEIEANVGEIARFARGALGADFALVMLPRAYQYSRRETPDNWERREYTPLGPYAREPFRWLRELAERVDYPAFGLLDDFRDSGVFPTTFAHDPHWNEAGHRLAAAAIAKRLIELGRSGRLRLPSGG
jgi:lysophospholipase L1-like esterase